MTDGIFDKIIDGIFRPVNRIMNDMWNRNIIIFGLLGLGGLLFAGFAFLVIWFFFLR